MKPDDREQPLPLSILFAGMMGVLLWLGVLLLALGILGLLPERAAGMELRIRQGAAVASEGTLLLPLFCLDTQPQQWIAWRDEVPSPSPQTLPLPMDATCQQDTVLLLLQSRFDVTFFTAPNPATEPEVLVPLDPLPHWLGDVTGDGRTGIGDAVRLLLGVRTGEALPPEIADLNGDTLTDTADLAALLLGLLRRPS